MFVLVSYLIAQGTVINRLKLKISLAPFFDTSQVYSLTERLAQSFKTCPLTVEYLCFVWRRRPWFIGEVKVKVLRITDHEGPEGE